MRMDVSAKETKNTTGKELYSLAERVVIKSGTLEGSLPTKIQHDLKQKNRNIESYYSIDIDHEGTHPTLMEKHDKEKGFSSNSKEAFLQRRLLNYNELKEMIEIYLKERNYLIFDNGDLVYDSYYKLFDKYGNDIYDDDPILIWPEYTTEVEKIIYALQYHYFIIAYYGKGYSMVARLILNAILSTIEGYGLWNISRGLHEHATEYVKYLDMYEYTQEGELWNNGQLSKRSANQYIRFMLEVALEQIDYVKEHLSIDKFHQNIQNYLHLSDKVSFKHELVLKELLLRGEIRRGEVPAIINRQSRTSTDLNKSLTDMDLITSDTPKGPIRLKFNTHLISHIFPGLIK